MYNQNDQKTEQVKKKQFLLKSFHEALKEQDNEPPKPNELDSTCGITDDELVKRFREEIKTRKIKVKDCPLPVTTTRKKASYIKYPDGRRIYGNES